MNNSILHNEIMASILENKINIPYAQWDDKINKPFQPVYKDLNKLVLKISPNIRKASLYKPSKSNSERQCLIRCRWIYEHPKSLFGKHRKSSIFLCSLLIIITVIVKILSLGDLIGGGLMKIQSRYVICSTKLKKMHSLFLQENQNLELQGQKIELLKINIQQDEYVLIKKTSKKHC